MPPLSSAARHVPLCLLTETIGHRAPPRDAFQLMTEFEVSFGGGVDSVVRRNERDAATISIPEELVLDATRMHVLSCRKTSAEQLRTLLPLSSAAHRQELLANSQDSSTIFVATLAKPLDITAHVDKSRAHECRSLVLLFDVLHRESAVVGREYLCTGMPLKFIADCLDDVERRTEAATHRFVGVTVWTRESPRAMFLNVHRDERSKHIFIERVVVRSELSFLYDRAHTGLDD